MINLFWNKSVWLSFLLAILVNLESLESSSTALLQSADNSVSLLPDQVTNKAWNKFTNLWSLSARFVRVLRTYFNALQMTITGNCYSGSCLNLTEKLTFDQSVVSDVFSAVMLFLVETLNRSYINSVWLTLIELLWEGWLKVTFLSLGYAKLHCVCS